MKYLLLLILFTFNSFAGFGGIAGGNNRHFQPYLNHPQFFINWPKVKINKKIILPVYEMCIFDKDFFKTKNPIEGKEIKVERLYSPINCKVKNDPQCDRILRYVDDYVPVHVYYVPKEFNRSKIKEEQVVTDQLLVDIPLYEIEECP